MKNHKILTILYLTAFFFNPVAGKVFESVPMEQWQFESYYLKYNNNWTASLLKSDSSTADYIYSSETSNAAIIGYLENGRAELRSPPLQLKPFTWYEVEIRYQTMGADDSLVTLAGLYPGSSRDLLDQLILPSTNGLVETHQVLLHSGASSQDYHFFLANTGIGKSLFYNFRFRELTSYHKPEENLMVVDLLKFKPNSENLILWKSLNKFTALFGFDEPFYMHPLKVRMKSIQKATPGIIVFTPTATDTEEFKMGFLKKRRFNKGIERIIKYAEVNRIPVFGICAGHQSIALHYGAFLARLKDDESGEYLKEIGPTNLDIVKEDPIFNNLADKKRLKITEAHMIMVGYNYDMPVNLATSTDFGNQIFCYNHVEGVPWYTFQGHIEKDWEYACPDGSVILNNLLINWGLIQNRFLMQEDLK